MPLGRFHIAHAFQTISRLSFLEPTLIVLGIEGTCPRARKVPWNDRPGSDVVPAGRNRLIGRLESLDIDLIGTGIPAGCLILALRPWPVMGPPSVRRPAVVQPQSVLLPGLGCPGRSRRLERVLPTFRQADPLPVRELGDGHPGVKEVGPELAITDGFPPRRAVDSGGRQRVALPAAGQVPLEPGSLVFS